MATSLTPQDAAAALADINNARSAMRHAIRAHRGHLHLWLWGAIWVAMPMLAQFRGDQAGRYFGLICLPGMIGSILIGARQSSQIRSPINRRFLGILAALIGFAIAFPFVLHARLETRELYTYVCLVCMFGYVIGGLWTDSYLLWLGLGVSVLILIGFFLLPGIFWWWMAACGGGSLILTGFYVRHFWH